jgi:Carboxypeptidase regulatory-like domain
MTRNWLFTILLLSGVLCAAQDDAAPTYAVHGTIVNAQTNQPIVRAEVILNQDYAVLTDAEGRFEFTHIPAGDFQVSVRRPGYISIGNMLTRSFGRGSPAPSQPARRIRLGPEMPDLTFRLTPEASIRGQVSLSAPGPADGIRVSAYHKRLRNGITHWEMAGTATTDSDGVFQFGDLAPGSYMLFSEPSPDRPAVGARGAVALGYPAEYYPGVTDPASAGILTVTAGQGAEADFALTQQAFYPLTAQVRAVEQGAPAAFQIFDSSGRPSNLRARYDPRDQTVHASVPNGSWILQAQYFGRDRAFGRTSFQVANGPANIAITILPTPRLQVTVHREFTSTAETQRGSGQMSGPGIGIQLEDEEPFGMGGMFSADFGPHADASSDTMRGTIDALPGLYRVTAYAGGTSYVSSMTSGGVDLVANPLVVSPNSSNAPIEVAVRNDFGTITGQVAGQVSGQVVGQTFGQVPGLGASGFGAGPGSVAGEIQQIYVYAIPLSSTATRNLSTSFSSSGQFTLPFLAPGSYRVVACDSEQEIDARTPEGLAVWAGKGQVVSVDAGGTATVELRVVHVEP